MCSAKLPDWLSRHKYLLCGLILGLMLAALLLSCSLNPGQKQPAAIAKKDNGEQIGKGEPKPGDVTTTDLAYPSR